MFVSSPCIIGTPISDPSKFSSTDVDIIYYYSTRVSIISIAMITG